MTQRDRELKKRRSDKSLASVQETVAPERQPAVQLGQDPATHAVGRIHEALGNQQVLEALASPAPEGLAATTAETVALGLAGVDPQERLPGTGSMSVLRELSHQELRRQAGQEGPATPDLGRLGRRGGRPLPEGVQERMERVFGHSFEHVRVHTDPEAARTAGAIDAKAFATGAEVFFGPGRWAPDSPAGEELLAHELAHVVQADEGRLPTPTGLQISEPADRAEVEADGMARRAVAGMHEVAAPTEPAAPAPGPAPEPTALHRKPGKDGGPHKQRERPEAGPRTGGRPDKPARGGHPGQGRARTPATPEPTWAPEDLAGTLAHVIGEILPPPDEEEQDKKGGKDGKDGKDGNARAARDGRPTGAPDGRDAAPRGGRPDGRGPAKDGAPPTGDQPGVDDEELTPKERLERVLSGEAEPPALDDDGPHPVHLQKALASFTPKERKAVVAKAEKGLDIVGLQELIPEALQRIAPVLDALEGEDARPTLPDLPLPKLTLHLHLPGAHGPRDAKPGKAGKPSAPASRAQHPAGSHRRAGTTSRLGGLPADAKQHGSGQPQPTRQPTPATLPDLVPSLPDLDAAAPGHGGSTPAANTPAHGGSPAATRPAKTAPPPAAATGAKDPRDAKDNKDKPDDKESKPEPSATDEEDAPGAKAKAPNPNELVKAQEVTQAPLPMSKADEKKAEIERLQIQKAYVESDIDSLGREMEAQNLDMQGKQGRVSKVQGKITDNQTRMQRRQAVLQHKAQAAQGKGPAPSPNRDSQLGFLKLTAKRLPAQVKAMQGQIPPLQQKSTRMGEEQAAKQEELAAIEEKLAELQKKQGGGGGGGGAPPNPNVPKICDDLEKQLKKLRPKVQKESEKAAKDKKDLAERLVQLDKDIAARTGEYRTVLTEEGDLQHRIDAAEESRKARVKELQSQGGQPDASGATPPTPSAASDETCQKLEEQKKELSKQLKEAQTRKERARQAKEKAENEKKERTALVKPTEEAAKKAEDKLKDLDKGVESLPGGYENYAEIAESFSLKPGKFFYPPGYPSWTPEDKGLDEAAFKAKYDKIKAEEKAKKEEEKKKKEGTGPVSLEDAKKDPNAKKEPEKPKTQAEKEEEDKKKKVVQEENLLRDVARIRDLPKDQREAELKKLAAAQKPAVVPADLTKKFDDKMGAAEGKLKQAEKALADKGIKLPVPDNPDALGKAAAAAGVSVGELKLYQEDKKRKEFQERAKTYMGGTSGEDSVDKLRDLAKERGYASPEDMLKHLVYSKAADLPPELRDLKAKVDQGESNNKFYQKELEAKAGPAPDGKGIAGAAAQAAYMAKLATLKLEESAKAGQVETKLRDNKVVATNLNVPPGEVDSYVKAMAQSMKISEEEARKRLTASPKIGEGQKLTDEQRAAQIAAIQATPPGPEKQAKLDELAKKVHPKDMLGNLLAAGEDGEGVVQGPVANQLLMDKIAAIDKIKDPSERMRARAALSETTGMPLSDLSLAHYNKDKKTRVMDGASGIMSNPDLTDKERDEKLEEFAKRNNMAAADLKKAYKDSVAKTEALLDQYTKGTGGDPKAKGTPANLIADLKAGKLGEQDYQAKLDKIARATGIPMDRLQRLYKDAQYKEQKRQWAEQLKIPADQVGDKVAIWARERGMPASKLVDHLRLLDPADLPPELQSAKKNLDTWDWDNAGKDGVKVDPTVEARKKAGLKPGEKITPILTDPKKIQALPEAERKAAEEAFAAYEKKKYALMDMANKRLGPAAYATLVANLTPQELAALLQDPTVQSYGRGPEAILKDALGKTNDVLNTKLAQATTFNQQVFEGLEGSRDKKAAAARATEQNAQAAMALQKQLEDELNKGEGEGDERVSVSLDEARAHLATLATTKGLTPAQALDMLKKSGASAQDAIRSAYSVGADGKASAGLKAQLDRINAMPPDEREKALANLRAFSGLSKDDLKNAQKQLTIEKHIVSSAQKVWELPEAERDKALQAIAEQTGKTLEEVKATYTAAIAAGGALLDNYKDPAARAAIDRLKSCAVGDLQANADEVARLTGMTKEEVLRIANSQRAAATNDKLKNSLGEQDQKDFREEAAKRNMTPEEFAQYLLRAPADELEGPAKALKGKIGAAGGAFQVQYTEAEEKARKQKLGDPTNPTYIANRNELFRQLVHDQTDDVILEKFRAMSPGERALFVKEWKEYAKNNLRDQRWQDPDWAFRDALQCGDEDTGRALLKDAVDWEAHPEKLEAVISKQVDVREGPYADKRKGLTTLLQSKEPDEDKIKEAFQGMTAEERAQFVRDWTLLQAASRQECDKQLRSHDEVLQNLDKFVDDDGFKAMVSDATRLSQDPLVNGARKKTQEVEKQVREMDRFLAVLRDPSKMGGAAAGWAGDRASAQAMLKAMADQNGLSTANMLNMLEGKPLVDESQTLPAYLQGNLRQAPSQTDPAAAEKWRQAREKAEKEGKYDPASGQKLSGLQIGKGFDDKKTRLNSFLTGQYMTDREVLNLLDGCNARELAELDKTLPGGLQSLISGRRNAYGDQLEGLDGAEAEELQAKIRQGKNWTAAAKDDQLVIDAKGIDPRASADINTPEGLAARLAWAKSLPPEHRLAEMNKLMGAQKADGTPLNAADIMQAFMGGAVSGDKSMITKGMLQQIQAAEALPKAEREKQLAILAQLGGYHAGAKTSAAQELQAAAKKSESSLKFATQYQKIKDMPEAERLAELNRLCTASLMTQGELEELLGKAQQAGMLELKPKPVPPEVDQRLAEIKQMTDPDKRREALAKLADVYQISQVDLIAHINKKSEDARKEREQVTRAEQDAKAIADKIKGGDEDEIREVMKKYGSDPEQMKRILDAYPGGAARLRAQIIDEFGSDDSVGKELNHFVDNAVHFDPTLAKVPEGVKPETSTRLEYLLRTNPTTGDPAADAERQRALEQFKLDNNLSEGDFAQLQKHAEYVNAHFDQDIAYKTDLLKAELSGWTDSDRMKEIVKGIPPDMLATIMERNPDLLDDVLGDVMGDADDDIRYHMKLADGIKGLDWDEKEKKVSELRMEHKFDQLKEEFGSWWREGDRVKELLADCSDAEVAALNKRFGGQLGVKVEESMKPTFLQVAVGTLATAVAFTVLGLVGGIAVGAMAIDMMTGAANDPEMIGLLGRVNSSSRDPKAEYTLDRNKVNGAAERLKDIKDDWFNDKSMLGTLAGLNPKELTDLARRMELKPPDPDAIVVPGKEGQQLSLMQLIETTMDGDEKAAAIASIRSAQDAVSGVDQRQQLNDTCRRLAIEDKIKELRKDPSTAKKSEEELFRIASTDKSLEQKTQERVKKVKDAANNVYKAIDGWGDNEKLLLQTLSGLGPEEMELVKVEYRRHFGKDMETQIKEDMGLTGSSGDKASAEAWKLGGSIALSVATLGISNFFVDDSQLEGMFTDKREGNIALMLMDPNRRVDGLKEYLLEYSDRALCEDEDLIYTTFENMSVEDRTKLVQGPAGQAFLARVKADLGSNEAARVDALTAINPETGLAEINPAHLAAAKMKMAMHGSGDWWDFSSWGTEENDLLNELDKLTPEQAREAINYYNDRLGEGSTFADDIASDLSGPELRVVEAEAQGDKVEADMWRLKYAAEWAGTDEKIMEETFRAAAEGRGGRSPEHLAQLKARFNATFGAPGGEYEDVKGTGQTALQAMIADETSGLQKVFFEQMSDKGKAEPELELLYALDGAGTDEERAKRIMGQVRDMSPSERAAFAKRFESLASDLVGSNQSLEDWVMGDFSGSEGLEMKLNLMGKPTTPEEYREQARMRFEFERSGLGAMLMDGLDAIGASSNASQLVKEQAEIEAMFGRDGKLKDPAKFEELKERCDWQTQDAANYRETLNKVADTVSNVAQVVGSVVLMVIPGLQGAAALIIANLILALAVAAVKAAIKGNGYGWEEAGADLANAAVSAAFAGVGALKAAGTGAAAAAQGMKQGASLTEFVAKKGVMGLLKEAGKEFLEGAGKSFATALINSDGALAQGDAEFAKYLFKETLMGGVQSTALFGVNKVIGKTPLGKRLDEIEAVNKGNKVGDSGSFFEQFSLKYTKSIITSSTSAALDHNKWEAWAKGEGVDFTLFKLIFIDSAVESLVDTGLTRTNMYRAAWTRHENAKAKKDVEDWDTAYAEAKRRYGEAKAEEVFGERLQQARQSLGESEDALHKLEKVEQRARDEAIATQKTRIQEVERQANQTPEDQKHTEPGDNPMAAGAGQDAAKVLLAGAKAQLKQAEDENDSGAAPKKAAQAAAEEAHLPAAAKAKTDTDEQKHEQAVSGATPKRAGDAEDHAEPRRKATIAEDEVDGKPATGAKVSKEEGLPPTRARTTVDLSEQSEAGLRKLGLSDDEASLIAQHTAKRETFEIQAFLDENPKVNPATLGRIARLTGTEDQVVALTRHPDESPAETAHRLGLDSAAYGRRIKVEGVAELHNHFKGVLDPEDYPKLLFPHVEDPHQAAAETLGLLKRMYDGNYDEVASKNGKDTASGKLVKAILEEPGADRDPMATLRRVMVASAEMPFDFTYDPRGAFIKHLQELDKGNPSRPHVTAFVEATVERLRAQGIRYAELQGKLDAPGLSPEEFKAICDKHGVKIRMLPHLLTSDLVPLDDTTDPKGFSRALIQKQLGKSKDEPDKPISELVAGVDICGPEAGKWSRKSMASVETAYEVLAEEAARAGRPLVLRPHVGEGYSEDPEIRRHGGGDDSEVAQTARNNLDVLLKHLDGMAKLPAGDPKRYVPPPEGQVIVRLGHVTHATDEHIEIMKRLGIIAEVNIGSNLATGSLPRDRDGAGRLDEHPLLKLMLAGVKTTLSTDAQGVMSTDMGREYGFAADIIDAFKRGESTIVVHGKRLTWEHLSPEQRAQIDIHVLHREAVDYAEGRTRWDHAQADAEQKPILALPPGRTPLMLPPHHEEGGPPASGSTPATPEQVADFTKAFNAKHGKGETEQSISPVGRRTITEQDADAKQSPEELDLSKRAAIDMQGGDHAPLAQRHPAGLPDEDPEPQTLRRAGAAPDEAPEPQAQRHQPEAGDEHLTRGIAFTASGGRGAVAAPVPSETGGEPGMVKARIPASKLAVILDLPEGMTPVQRQVYVRAALSHLGFDGALDQDLEAQIADPSVTNLRVGKRLQIADAIDQHRSRALRGLLEDMQRQFPDLHIQPRRLTEGDPTVTLELSGGATRQARAYLEASAEIELGGSLGRTLGVELSQAPVRAHPAVPGAEEAAATPDEVKGTFRDRLTHLIPDGMGGARREFIPDGRGGSQAYVGQYGFDGVVGDDGTYKGGRGHAIYEEVRTLQANAAREGRDFTGEERQRMADITAESEGLYGAAYQRALGHPPTGAQAPLSPAAPSAPAPRVMQPPKAAIVDLDQADVDDLVQAGFTKKEARRIQALREQNGGVFDFAAFAAMNADHEVRVLAKAAKLSGREREAVNAVMGQHESEAEAAQRIGLDPRPFGRRVEVERVAEVHNHFKGILPADEFPGLLIPELHDQPHEAAQRTVVLLRRLYQEDPDGELHLPHKKQATDKILAILESDGARRDPGEALRLVMSASAEMPFDFTYDPRGLLIDHIRGQGRAEAFVEATILSLKRQGVTYAELQGKLDTPGVDPETFAAIGARHGVKIRMLPHLLTQQFAEGGDGFTEEKLHKLLFGKDWREKGEVPDMIAGIDICGPENGRWDEAGMTHLEQAFTLLQQQAELSGRKLVLRPHGGEGYSGTEGQRRLGVEDDARQGRIAHENLDAILGRLQKMRDEGTYRPPPEGSVEIRLGHVTQATEEQVRRMIQLGVIAEVNIGSNLVTGALGRAHGESASRLDEHPLLMLLYHGVPTLLSTDAQGVMSTDIAKEYGFAADLVDRFRRGERFLTVPDTKDPTQRLRVRFEDLPPELQARFDVRRLEADAQDYAEQATRRRPADSGPDPQHPTGHRPAAPVGPDLNAPEPGKAVTQPKQGDTPLIGLSTRFFDPEASADDLAEQIAQDGVPRQQRLSASEREAETGFADWLQANPNLARNRALQIAQTIGNPDQPIFEVDAMKRLIPSYGAGSKPASDEERAYRLEQNHALHPTAVAIARLGFMARLDELAALPEVHPLRQVLVTNGGCGAGKSVLTDAVKNGLGDSATFGAVWDAAGEGDALESAWILRAAQSRGIKVVVGYAEADPTTRYQGVLDRAASSGRVVDVLTFINSYCDGASEMKRFMASSEYKKAVADGQAASFGVAPGEVNPAAFTDKSQKVFPNMRSLHPDGPMEAQHVGAAPDKQAALEASLRILEDYVARERGAGKDPSAVARGALENALKFMRDQPPEIQSAILASYGRIFEGRAP